MIIQLTDVTFSDSLPSVFEHNYMCPDQTHGNTIVTSHRFIYNGKTPSKSYTNNGDERRSQVNNELILNNTQNMSYGLHSVFKQSLEPQLNGGTINNIDALDFASEFQMYTIEKKNNWNIEPLLNLKTIDVLINNDRDKRKNKGLHRSSTLIQLCKQKKALDCYKGPALGYNVKKIFVVNKKPDSKIYYSPETIKYSYDSSAKDKRAKTLPNYLHRISSHIHHITDKTLLHNKDPESTNHFAKYIYNQTNHKVGKHIDLKASDTNKMDEPIDNYKSSTSYNVDKIIHGIDSKSKPKSPLLLNPSKGEDNRNESLVIDNNRDDSPNRRILMDALNVKNVQKKNDYYEIELNSTQHNTNNRMSYVLAVGVTIGAVGIYVASQTMKRGFQFLGYLKK